MGLCRCDRGIGIPWCGAKGGFWLTPCHSLYNSVFMHLYQHIMSRHQFLYRIIHLLLMLLCSPGISAQPITSLKQTDPSISTIEIPMRLPLAPLIKAAEKTLPQQAGNWRSWKDWHGIKSQYRAWRGPLSITASGDVLLVQAHIRYWIRARKKVLGAINLKGSCGVNEPPRQAVIGMQVRLGWGPDWTVRPEFRILPTRFLDRCEMTIANIDITPLVEREFRKRMQESLRAALRTLAPSMKNVHKKAQRTWLLLQEPVELGLGHRLLFRPMGIALSGITGMGDNINTHLAIAFRPIFLQGTEALGDLAPLPQLERYYPHSSGLNLHLSSNQDLSTLGQKLSSALAGQSFNIHGQQVGINSLTLAGSGQEIMARIDLLGEIGGTIELKTRLVFNLDKQKLELHDLTFDYDASNPAVALLEERFHESIRQVLEDTVNGSLHRHLVLLSERIETALKKAMPAGVMLDMSSLQLLNLQVHISQQSIVLNGTTTGSVHLTLH